MSNSSPAAPKTIVELVGETSVNLFFWYHTSGLAKLVQEQKLRSDQAQEKQRDRDAQVSRIEIQPGDVTVRTDEQLQMIATAYDSNGAVVGGVRIKWSAEDEEGKRVRVLPRGEFESVRPGTFKITARAAGQTDQTTITVIPSEGQRKRNEIPLRTTTVSSRDLPGKAALNSTKPQRNKKAAHATPMMQGGAGWDSSNYWSANRPENRVGDPPGTTMDGGAGSGNFQFATPVLTLPGRGINLALTLAYNARLWNKAGSQISYDNDRGWPAPGFSLGFGKLLGMTINSGCMLVDANGTRHSYSGNITFYSWGTYGVMHTTDGSFIDYTYWTGTNGVITSAQANLPNGTVIYYGAYSQAGGGVFPTFIEDANGNHITITYVNNSGPRIQTVMDTLGRVVNFHYDYNNLLTAVTTSGLAGGTRTLVRLHYNQQSINYGFSGLNAVVRDYYPWVIDAIYYPATGTGYWFGDSDSYSSYGMLAKVVEQRAMGFSASSLNDMGNVSQGQTSRTETYNFPLTPNYGLGDAPSFTTMVQSWTRDGTNFDSATTTYEVNENSYPRTVLVTLPNCLKNLQQSYNSPGSYLDGLVYYDETRDASNNLLKSSTAEWAPGAYDSPRPTRVTKTDERNQTTATEYSYGSLYNQVTEIRSYDYGGTNLHRVLRTQYQNSSNYTSRHIFNLPLTVEIFAGDNVTRVSRTEYQYDGQTLSAAPNVVQHDQAYNPNADAEGYCYWENDWNDGDCRGSCMSSCWDCPQEPSCDGYCPQYYICPYNSSTDYRGNITKVTNYADSVNLTGAAIETRRYDITGNLVTSSNSCCQQTSFTYTIDTQYAYPQEKTRGSATDPYVQISNYATFDFNTGLSLTVTDENGRQSSNSYDAASLRTLVSTLPTGGHTNYSYDDGAMSITRTAYLSAGEGGGIAEQNVKLLNGLGEIRTEKALGVSGVWDLVDTVYDNMGRPSQQTLPYRSGDTPQWTTTSYDILGRVISVTTPDGTVTETFYNEATRPSVASGTPGETTRIRDAWGRERWGRSDSTGHLVEVVEPDPNGSGSVATNGMVTTYSYNTLGKLTGIVQGAQTRSFKYDSLGRMTAQKLAEMSATLNDAGTYVGSGPWSDVFTYDDRSNLISSTDARGVKTIYNYGNDPLNRIQSVSWDTSGFGDTGNPILGAATVTYQYRQKASPSDQKDITQTQTITTAAVSSESYSYDVEGRVSFKTLTLNSRSSYPFTTDYIYDSLDRIRDVRYPAEYGNGSAPRKLVHHDYDIASRFSGLTVDGQTFASNVVYNAASQTTSVAVGSGTNQVLEAYAYNGQTGLLNGQTASRNGVTLLNLSYDFAGTNGKRTSQVVRITNNLDQTKNRGYEYDTLGRLRRATGGQNVNWVERYEYDRYGNRHNAYSFTAEQYVRNFFQNGLNRQPNSTELQTWITTLQSAYAQGPTQFLTAMQNLGEFIFTHAEYNEPDNREYVKDLYRTYLFRESDQGGEDFWTTQVPTNGRAGVRAGFAWSIEFNVKVNAISPYGHPSGNPVPQDGWNSIAFDSATNRVANSGWTYDAAGNQTRVRVASGWQRFQYDAAGRMVKVKADDNVTVLSTSTYGHSSDRLLVEEGGTRTYYALGSIAEYTETGGSTTPSWSRSYISLGGRLLSTLTPNGSGGEAVEHHHPDRLGTRLVTNPGTGGSFEQVTLPFGTSLNAESTGATNRRFTSYDRSGVTGLDYAVNRHYDSQQGRFTQVDPAGMNATDLSSPQTLNLYAYCANDPINHTDPSGLGFFSFLKKVFKAILKVLQNKWVQLAIAIAIIALAHFYPNSLFGSLGGAHTSHAAAAPSLHASTIPATAAGRAAAAAAAAAATGSAAIEGVIAGTALVDAVSLGLAAAQAAGAVAQALEGKQLDDYKDYKQEAKQNVMKKPCQDFLRAHGINPKAVLNAIEKQRPFDGLRSTLTLRAAGVVGKGSRYAAWTVQQYFQTFEPGAMTANARRATRFDVYFGSYYGPNPRMTIIHEALHSVTMLGDWDLARKLGIITDSNVFDFIRAGRNASAEINGHLATHGCFQL
jgi:RHS repeat-associated protein